MSEERSNHSSPPAPAPPVQESSERRRSIVDQTVEEQGSTAAPPHIVGLAVAARPMVSFHSTAGAMEHGGGGGGGGGDTEVADYSRGGQLGPYGPPDFKLDFEEMCPVCGDKVSGYHYGMPTCESCKGFFKRTVQNKKVYSCVDNRQCMIDKTQRKRCPYCRFQKCLSVGMKLEAVRSDRMRGGRNKFGPMYKRDRAIKQQAMRQRQQMLAQMQCQMQLGMNMNGNGNGNGPPGMPPGMHPSFMDGMCEPPDIKPNIAMLGIAPPPGSSPGSMHHNMMVMGHQGGAPPPHHMQQQGGSSRMPLHLGGSSSASSSDMASSHSPLSSSQAVSSSAGLSSYHPSGPYTSMMSSLGSMPPPPPPPGPPGPHHHMTELSSGSGSSSSSLLPLPPPPPSHHLVPTSSSHMVPPLPSPPTSAANTNSSLHNGGGGPGATAAAAVTSASNTTSALSPSSSSTSSAAAAAAAGTGSDSTSPVPQVIRDLQHNEANPVDVQRKLASTAEMMMQQQEQERTAAAGADTRPSTEERAEGTDLSKAQIQLLCKLCDQALFLLVEWARGAHFFKELKVEDQMKLLQNCWSELLILDFIFKQMEHSNSDELLLITGHTVPMDMLNRIGLGDCKDRLQELIKKFRDLKLDRNEYSCLRHLVLLNPDVATLSNRGAVEQCQEKVNTTLLEYCSTFYQSIRDKFGQLLVRLPEIRLISLRAEDYLYFRHLSGDIPESTLLMEMLHSKRK